MSGPMAFYEHIVIARQDVSAAQVDTIIDQMTEILDQNGGRVALREYWGLRNLSYRIKKNRKGHYVMLRVDAPSAAMQEVERNLRLHEDVLRYLTVRQDALDETPSVVMQNKSSRDGRRRDRDDRPRDRDDREPKGGEE